ncbi:TonB-dependent receptor [Flavobacterium antarcticum]|uniref:SusC/RagA family TonB-linked outer membrane protein n=1 Tax=Flavobacterium antarcticum TaxID=271155 RepID=UPI0003B6B975|nr:TonB-dependent receptor [Flavobacterium antarcticum]
MKTIYNKLLFLVLLFPFSILAQSTFTGTVLDQASNQSLPGVNVVVEGTQNGTSTDFDGKFSLNVKKGDVIVFSYIGYKNYAVVYASQKDITIVLQEDSSQLNEVVVIGYGSVKKKDATGALSTVSSEDFNRGPLVSADQLIQGKVSGLQIINGGGAPGEGAQIRIRSGSSLSAGNDPLYVIDGVPLDTGGGAVQGGRNPLSVINQNDIASMTILKDASATAIYGSRASNGVIIITTKKGKSGDMQVNYNANFSVGQITDYVDVLSAKQFSDFVMAKGTVAQQGLLGTANTDWQKEIYRTALGTDHNVSFSGGLENLNYRASLGYSDLNGILQKDNFQRVTLNVNLLGKFFDNHLKVEFTNKTSSNKNNYSERGAIGAAVSFDPTQQIYDDTYGYDYFQWLGSDTSNPADGIPDQEVNAGRNPLSLINQKTNKGLQYRSIGNVQFDYKLHFLPELKAVANFGYDYSSGKGYGFTDANYVVLGERNGNYNNLEEKKNQVMDLYLNYNKTFDALSTNLDFTGGYNYQNFNYINSSFTNDVINNVVNQGASSNETVNLQSIFARAIFSIADKYILTGSIRRDGSSRFTEENRWGNFPSAAFAWKISEEGFLRDNKVVSDLKFRASWGITGQQEIGKRYPTTPLYLNSTETASYQIGYDANGLPIYLQPYRPQPYNLNLKWEETKQLNLGLDFGLFDNRITGSAEVYKKNSSDLIVFTANPQGVGFSNADFYNIGDMEFKGVELSMDVYPVKNETVQWRVGGNITFQDAKVTKLNLIQSADSEGIIDVGGISGGTGNFVQNHQVGYSPNSFYVFEQVYDAAGAPVEGVYVDRNKDDQVNENDLYRYKKPSADFYYGFNTDVSYKNFDFSMSWRGSYGNYNYNNVYSNFGSVSTALPGNGNYLQNASSNVLETNFFTPQYSSDYYVQDASFVRLDNVTLGYSFPDALGKGKNLRLTGAVQNVLVITDYKGIDPEVSGGIDNNLYPRPRTYTLGLNVNF